MGRPWWFPVGRSWWFLSATENLNGILRTISCHSCIVDELWNRGFTYCFSFVLGSCVNVLKSPEGSCLVVCKPFEKFRRANIKIWNQCWWGVPKPREHTFYNYYAMYVLNKCFDKFKKTNLLGRQMLLVLCCVCLVNVLRNSYEFVACVVSVLISSEGHNLR